MTKKRRFLCVLPSGVVTIASEMFYRWPAAADHVRRGDGSITMRAFAALMARLLHGLTFHMSFLPPDEKGSTSD